MATRGQKLYARAMRKAPTRHEAALWQALRGKKLDGDIHENQDEYDRVRDNYLKEIGYKILRMPNNMIEFQLEQALELIRNIIREQDL